MQAKPRQMLSNVQGLVSLHVLQHSLLPCGGRREMLSLPAGDLHFYMRHSFQPYRPSEKAEPPANGDSPSGRHSSSADTGAHVSGRSASITDRPDGTSLGGGKGLGGECRRLLLLLSIHLLYQWPC